jgi:hypothetical protein
MFRHGARSTWAKDPMPQSPDVIGEKWSDGFGELTNIGKRQHYLLGSVSRKDFAGYLSANYDPHEIYVVSTDYNRTLMSVQSHLQGLYPSSVDIKLTEDQQSKAIPPMQGYDYEELKKQLGTNPLPNNMQVLPIHILDRRGHEFYLHDKEVCPRSFDVRTKNAEDPEIIKLNDQIIRDYSEKLNKVSALKDYNFRESYDALYFIMDAYVSAYTDGRTLEEFTKAGIDKDEFYKTALGFMYNDMFRFAFGSYGSEENYIGRMSMSPTHRKILNWMDTRISRDNEKKGYESFVAPKLVIYSGHDTNLAAMQVFLKAALGIKEYKYVPFASLLRYTLLRKKYDDKDHKYVEDDYQVKIEINGLPLHETMSFKDFKAKLQLALVSPDDIASFCGFTPPFKYYGFMIATICLSILVVGLIAYLVILSRKQSRGEGDANYVKV